MGQDQSMGEEQKDGALVRFHCVSFNSRAIVGGGRFLAGLIDSIQVRIN